MLSLPLTFILFFSPLIASASIYDLMREVTRQEFLMDPQGGPADSLSLRKVEAIIAKFVARIHSRPADARPGGGSPAELVLRGDVSRAFSLYDTELCVEKSYRRGYPFGSCDSDFKQKLRDSARREERVRTLGRDLQTIASSYELPVDVYEQRMLDLPTRYRGIIKIWQAGTGANVVAGSGLLVRSMALPTDIDGQIQALSGNLQSLVQGTDGDALRERFTGAVWRYAHGIRFVEQKSASENPDGWSEEGSERQYLFKRWPEIESPLAAIEQRLNQLAQDASVVDPPLRRGEILLFTTRRDIAENVILWAYQEKDAVDGVIRGDAGLYWDTPVEPVQPSLCRDQSAADTDPLQNTCETGANMVTTLGGRYPPPATDGIALCSHPLARLGYLCRPIPLKEGESCLQELQPQDGMILLSACTKEEDIVETVSGPDACMMNWTVNAPPFDPQKQCTVALGCGGSFTGGQTDAKTPDGTIRVSVSENPSAPAPYYFIHELVHAKQLCDLPPGRNTYGNPGEPGALEGCCRAEGEAYRAQCEAYAEDGIFGTGQEISPSTNVPINVETCAQVYTDYSCRDRGYGACPNTFSFLAQDQNQLLNFILDVEQLANDRKPALTPTSCSAALNPPQGQQVDPRILGRLQEFRTTGVEVCSPARRTEYDNSIGNNMCFLSQCLEYVMENHQLIPARATFTTQESAFTNQMCVRPDPAFGALTTSPTSPQTQFPPYRPALLMKQLDIALCQAYGLPPETPPVVCAFEATRRLRSPSINPLENAQNILNQAQQQLTPVFGLQSVSEGMGARVGSMLYGDYLQRISQFLGNITQTAADLLESFTEVEWSRVMCPLNDAGGQGLLQTEFCAVSSSSSSAP